MAAGNVLIPNLFVQCPYDLRLHPHTEAVGKGTQEWILGEVNFEGAKKDSYLKTQGGLLGGYCYPDADTYHVQVCGDWMDWAFCLDDWSDNCTAVETQLAVTSLKKCLRDPHGCSNQEPFFRLSKNLFSRFFETAGPRCAKRFIEAMDLYLDGVLQESACREDCIIPDMESFITLRRNTSGLRPSFVLSEFAAGVDLPDEVVEHPFVRAMEDAANDWVAWTNDLFSYKKEKSVDGTHNIVMILMKERGLEVQPAIDLAGQYCGGCITKFEENRKALPSWGAEIDRQVNLYVEGLRNWIVGSLHWSFACQRYFGTEGEAIKMHRTVRLMSEDSM